jgi:high-affinity K+ transport system ATPase subunit B
MTGHAVPVPDTPEVPVVPPAQTRPPKVRTRPTSSLLEPSILRRAVLEAFVKLNPRTMIRNPVMFVVEIGSVITTVEFFGRPDVFVGLVTVWLWATVLFANFAEAVAEGRGKAQADTLRRGRRETMAHRLGPDGTTQEIPAAQLRAGDLCVVTAGQVIPGDGDVVEGVAVVDESAITGESAPVIRESGGDRGGLLSAIGIAGMDRMVQRNVLAMSGRAVEAAGDCSTLLLDKTGTIAYGNRMAAEFIPVAGVTGRELGEAAYLSSMADETPEGRSIVDLAESLYPLVPPEIADAGLVPFSAQTRMSGIDLGPRRIRKGAADSVRRWVEDAGGVIPRDLAPVVERIASGGGTPLVVADGPRVLGVIHLKDTVKAGMTERFRQLRDMGIRTVMITGDNPLTARAIAAEAGVDDFLAEATPEEKLALIRREQRGGHMVAMTGDGTNDAPALAQADVGLAMNTGTQAAKEAGNMVDLDSNPTKLIEVVEVAKQLLITRGSLTTFSIANDVAKYFAIIPAMFVAVYPALRVLNVMRLDNPHTAILAAVIYNALIIPALIPLALRGVKFRPRDGAAILRRNGLIYGVGGIIAPFVFIKLLDLLLAAMGLH